MKVASKIHLGKLNRQQCDLFDLSSAPFVFSFMQCWRIFVIYLSLGVSMDNFFEASLVLLHPLEDFFNNVFVMAVSIILCNYLLCQKQRALSAS